jgi:hypothetical protein
LSLSSTSSSFPILVGLNIQLAVRKANHNPTLFFGSVDHLIFIYLFS